MMGAIMCMGVATANSILVISFAKERLVEMATRWRRLWSAGFTRFRPVIMTALAMIIGMVPMALGVGEGGEQNAPLGRAVIGGLLFATVATLIICTRGVRHAASSAKAGSGMKKTSPGLIAGILIVVLLLAAALGVSIRSGIRTRVEATGTLAHDTQQSAVPLVTVEHPQSIAPSQELVLPGNAQAFVSAAHLRAHQRVPQTLVRGYR